MLPIYQCSQRLLWKLATVSLSISYGEIISVYNCGKTFRGKCPSTFMMQGCPTKPVREEQVNTRLCSIPIASTAACPRVHRSCTLGEAPSQYLANGHRPKRLTLRPFRGIAWRGKGSLANVVVWFCGLSRQLLSGRFR